MVACLDVAHEDAAAYAAGMIFRDWADASPLQGESEVLVGVLGLGRDLDRASAIEFSRIPEDGSRARLGLP